MNSSKIFIFLILCLLFSNCLGQKSEVEAPKENNRIIKEPTSYEHILELPSDLRTFIFFDTAKIYSSPDTLSKIIRTLKFSDSQYSVKEYLFNNGEYWYKLNGWNPDFKDGGYIKSEVMSNFYTSQSKYDLGFLGKIISTTDSSESFSLKLFNTSNFEIIKEHLIPYHYSYYNIDVLYESQHILKGANYIFHYKTESEECPSGFYEEIIVSTNDNLIKLWSSENLKFEENNDQLESEFHTVYIPISTANKSILAPWGNFKDILKPDLTLDIIDTSSLEIPITELVILKRTSIYLDNSKKEHLTYYKWNGRILELVK